MNIREIKGRPLFRSKIVLRLWLIMMALVLLSVGFMWVVQIFLFEQNYVDSTINELRGRLEPMMEDLKTEDLAENGSLISYLSQSTGGKMVLMDRTGILIALYSYGYLLDRDVADTENVTWHNIRESAEYAQVLRSEEYQKVYKNSSGITAFEIGIPVTYDGQEAYIVLYHSLSEIHTVLDMNRRQLTALTIILAVVAAVLAAILAKQFTKPIHIIKNTVNGLTKGDLAATPGLQRNDELGELSDSVDELGQALQRLDVLRKEVIANVSHELRSPLALVVGYAEMVRDVTWKNDVMRTQNLNLIITESRRLSEMVSDIMDYSQFQAGYIQMKKDWYNLYDIVDSETEHCGKSAKDHQIEIRLISPETEFPVYADALKLTQVMRNLLYNAINHTDDGQAITVRMEKNREGIRVSIENPGDPIPEEERELIWERYHRSQHQGSRRQGSGLGLSIVSTILGAHEMEYGVDHRDGLTIFWFRYPERLIKNQKPPKKHQQEVSGPSIANTET